MTEKLKAIMSGTYIPTPREPDAMTFGLNATQNKKAESIYQTFLELEKVSGSKEGNIVNTSYVFENSSGIGQNVTYIVRISRENKKDIILEFDLTDYESW